MRVQHRLRARLTIASFLLSALVVTGAVAGLVGVLHVETAATIRARLQDRGDALVAAIDIAHGTVDISGSDDLLLDSPNWVFTASGALLDGSRPRGAVGAAVRRLGASTTRRTAASGPLHLLAIPVRSGGRIVAVAVTGVDEAPYAATLTAITWNAALLGLLAILGATGLAALVLGRSLGPMTAMAERAAEWSRHRSGSRFALGPPRDELTGLAAVLDELLDRVEEALTIERRLSAEIAHELRSPLTLLIGETDLALMSRTTPASERARYERIGEAARTMARAITALLDDAATGAEGPPDSAVLDVVEAVVASMHAPVRVEVSGEPVRARVRPLQLERMLAPLLENAAAAAASTVGVVVRTEGDEVVVHVTDDGGGIDAAVLPTLFEPGVSTRPGGTGLGLALVRRLVLEAGGDVRVAQAVPAEFELRLPRARTPEKVPTSR